MLHVALLRAVNVGGRSSLAMADLRAVAEGLGYGEVTTFLQSGNLVFDAKGRPAKDLFAIGPITRGTFWEITAVPDIRIACETLAEHLLPSSRVAAAEQQRARA